MTGWSNIALVSREASCEASSQYNDDFRCEKALDGMTITLAVSEWATSNQGMGSWFKVGTNNKRHKKPFVLRLIMGVKANKNAVRFGCVCAMIYSE